jgi:TP901 family phage tail tape measure protein
MNRSLVATFILRLQDRTSAGLGALQRRLQGLGQMARRLGVAGGIAAAVTFAGPLREAAAFDDMLRQTAMTAGLSGRAVEEFIARQGAAYERLARETGQTSMAIAQSAGQMAAAGLNPELVSRFSPILARFATATGASLADLGQVAVRLNQNLKIESVEEMQGALAGMLQASRDGSVEITDMARLFPTLTAQVEALGVRGRPAVNMLASLLQVAARGAASSAEAGTNLANFLSKLTAPETVRNFEKMGVNIEAVMQDAARRGINPIEAMIQKVREVSGGNMFRVGELFGDMQVLNFLRPMLAGTREYLTILEGARNANTAIVDASFEDRFRGLQIQLALTGEIATQFGRRLGVALTPAITMLADGMKWLIERMEQLDQDFPGLVNKIGLGVGAFTVLAAAAGLLGLVIGPIGAGLLILKGALGLAMAPLHGLVRLLMALGAPAGVAAGAVTLLATGMVMAALHIWRNWDRFAAFFRQMGRGLRNVAAGVIQYFLGVFTLDARRSVAGLERIWTGLSGFFAGLWGTIRGVFNDFTAWVDGWTGGAATSALNGLLALIEGVQMAWDAFRSSFTTGELPSVAGVGPALGRVQERQRAARANPAGAFYPPEAVAGATGGAAPPRLDGRVTVEVRPAPGAEIVSTESDSINVTVTAPAPNRGATRGRP